MVCLRQKQQVCLSFQPFYIAQYNAQCAHKLNAGYYFLTTAARSRLRLLFLIWSPPMSDVKNFTYNNEETLLSSQQCLYYLCCYYILQETHLRTYFFGLAEGVRGRGT